MSYGWDDDDDDDDPRDAVEALLHGAAAAQSEAAIAARDAEPDEQSIIDPPAPATETDPFALEQRQALADVKAALGTAAGAHRAPMFAPASSLFGVEFPPTPWLVTGLMTREGVAQNSGEPKTGKSWAALEIAVAITTGTKAFGEFFAERGAVAYFFAEDDARSVRNRIRALMVGRGLPPVAPDGLFVCPRGKFLDIVKEEDLAWVVASARRLGPLDLLVLDPLRDISSAAENDSDEMRGVMRNLRLLGELLGCVVLFVHHAIKAGVDNKTRSPGQRSRGSSAIHGATDSGFYLTALEGDGQQHFELGATSEIKGAKSAGYFGITLDIADDDNREAVRAVWSVDREKTKGKARPKGPARPTAETDDAKMLAFVRNLASRGEVLNRRTLRDHDEVPIAEKRAREALARLTEDDGPLMLGAGGKVIPRGRP